MLTERIKSIDMILIFHAIGLNHKLIKQTGKEGKVLLYLLIYLILYISQNIRIGYEVEK